MFTCRLCTEFLVPYFPNANFKCSTTPILIRKISAKGRSVPWGENEWFPCRDSTRRLCNRANNHSMGQPILWRHSRSYDGTTMEATRRTISSQPQHRNHHQFSLSTDKISNKRNGKQMLFLKNLPNFPSIFQTQHLSDLIYPLLLIPIFLISFK